MNELDNLKIFPYISISRWMRLLLNISFLVLFSFLNLYAAPAVSITSPGNGDIFGVSDVRVKWTTSGVESGTEAFRWSTDGNSWTDITDSTHTFLFTNLTTGDHTLHIQVVDKDGDTGSASVSVVVDTEDPVVNITAPSNNAIFGTGNVTVSWTVSNVHSGIEKFRSSSDGISWTDIGT
ncbi:MAG: hypothetical protein GX817_03645, partial [Elusimicrobia bacterium]|nr:hypothetical protein [Elusimicrobiota bacterium]